MNTLGKDAAMSIEVEESADGQRLDNFLLARLKGVPKSHVYRIVRTGQVRVNRKRAEASQRLQVGDAIRIPPVRTQPAREPIAAVRAGDIMRHIIYEDSDLLAIDKPPGMAAHGGSGVSLGVIEKMRAARPELKSLALAHRLDRDTSGVLVLAKKRSALLKLHALLREAAVEKRYLALVKGSWQWERRVVHLPLYKYVNARGERRVEVVAEGMPAETVFWLKRAMGEYTLLEARLKTGRTHQIRVHLAHLGFPILGDEKYGDFALNKRLAKQGLKRMFLHAAEIAFPHPVSGQALRIEAPLHEELASFLDRIGCILPSRALRERT